MKARKKRAPKARPRALPESVVDLQVVRKAKVEHTPEVKALKQQIDTNMGLMLGASKGAWQAYDRLRELGVYP